MDFDALYTILTAVARRQGQITYTELSQAYAAPTGDWIEPHGGWDDPLGQTNQRLHAAGLEPLSAVVVLAETREPGGGFWGSSGNVPPKPNNSVARIAAYGQILGRVYAIRWPTVMP